MYNYLETSNELKYNHTYNHTYNYYQYSSDNYNFVKDPESYLELYFNILVPPVFLVLFTYFLTRFLIHNKKNALNENNIPTELDERMKYYEIISRSFNVIPQESQFLIRLDGRAFSNFTKKLLNLEEDNTKPYSEKFQKVMILTAETLQKQFKCATSYTHSDEITLIFNHPNQESEHLFGGRVDKLLSLTASCAGSAFLYNLMSFFGDKLNYKEPHMFDARLVVFPPEKEYEIVNYMIWRSKGDCTRNFIAMYAEKYLSKKTIVGMTKEKRLEALKELGYDLDLETTNFALKHGVFIKYDRSTKKHNYWVFKNVKFNPEIYQFLTENHDYDLYLPDELEKDLGLCYYEFDENYELIRF